MAQEILEIGEGQLEVLIAAINGSKYFFVDGTDVHVRAPPNDFPTIFKKLFPTVGDLPRLMRIFRQNYSRPIAQLADGSLLLKNGDYSKVSGYHPLLRELASPYLRGV